VVQTQAELAEFNNRFRKVSLLGERRQSKSDLLLDDAKNKDRFHIGFGEGKRCNTCPGQLSSLAQPLSSRVITGVGVAIARAGIAYECPKKRSQKRCNQVSSMTSPEWGEFRPVSAPEPLKSGRSTPGSTSSRRTQREDEALSQSNGGF